MGGYARNGGACRFGEVVEHQADPTRNTGDFTDLGVDLLDPWTDD